MPAFLRSPYFLIFTFVAAAQGAIGYYLNARKEYVPPVRPLAELAQSAGDWRVNKEWPINPEVQEVLKADDTISRDYVNERENSLANVFVAFFKSQRAGVAPHSPKNCLPGNGWVSEKNTIIQIDVPGRGPIEANYYLVQRGDNKSVVIYWYQSHGRVVASEYEAKMYVVADAIRLNRTDTSLVKLTLPVGPRGVETTSRLGVELARELFQPISQILPN
jgi:EpsI family protein